MAKRLFYLFWFSLSLTMALGSATAWAERDQIDDPETYVVGHNYFALIDHLWPTQFRVGYHSKNDKQKKIEKMNKKERQKYLAENPIPIIVGPKNRLYLVDHHHLARAIEDAGYKKIVVEVIKNWHEYDTDEFWQKMRQEHFVFQYDTVTRRRVSVEHLPQHIEEMKDDPYRSLAGDLREDGFFSKQDGQYFIEFAWARALSLHFENLGVDVKTTKYKKLLKLAREFAASDKADDLPGRDAKHCAHYLKKIEED